MSSAVQSVNAALLYPGPNRDLRVEERPLWPPKSHEVQIAVAATGLCGSDLHYYAHGRNGDFQVRQPLVLGHEAAGVVTAVGSSVTHVRVGQRVAIEAGIYCRQCTYCEQKRYNLCKAMKFCSSASVFPHFDGTLQERMNHPAFVVHPCVPISVLRSDSFSSSPSLPDNCTYEQASLAEPLSVLIHASRRANLTAGHSVLVFGVGTIGLLACALAKARGASRIVAVDINQTRLDFARENGFASQTFCLPLPPAPSSASASTHVCSHSPSQAPTPQQLSAERRKEVDDQIRRMKDTMSGILTEFDQKDGFDLVYECTGAESAIQMSVFVSLSSFFSSPFSFPLPRATGLATRLIACQMPRPRFTPSFRSLSLVLGHNATRGLLPFHISNRGVGLSPLSTFDELISGFMPLRPSTEASSLERPM